jgi:hypothetical protein
MSQKAIAFPSIPNTVRFQPAADVGMMSPELVWSSKVIMAQVTDAGRNSLTLLEEKRPLT